MKLTVTYSPLGGYSTCLRIKILKLDYLHQEYNLHKSTVKKTSLQSYFSCRPITELKIWFSQLNIFLCKIFNTLLYLCVISSARPYAYNVLCNSGKYQNFILIKICAGRGRRQKIRRCNYNWSGVGSATHLLYCAQGFCQSFLLSYSVVAGCQSFRPIARTLVILTF